MTLTRRAMLAGAAAGTAGLLVKPRWGWSGIDLGGMRIDTLSDGNLQLPADFIFGPMPAEEIAPIREKYGLTGDALTPPCNVTLLRHEDRVVLFDTGSGPAFQDSAGYLLDALDEAGVAPEEVTHVVFTHGHPDHLWGVLDDFDDPLFYDARHMMGRAEFDYWTDPDTLDTIGAERQSFAVGAARRLEMLADRIAFFEDGDEILPGVAARLTPGHTPGHMAFELRDGSESVMVVGDCIGNHHVAFEKPSIPSGSDQDPETAAATRTALLARLADEQMRLIGFHLPEGGIGRAEKHGDGYVFAPTES